MILIAAVPCHCLSLTLDNLIWLFLSELNEKHNDAGGGGGGYTERLTCSPILVISLKCSS